MKTYRYKNKDIEAFRWKSCVFDEIIRKFNDPNAPKDAICEVCDHKLYEHGEITSYGKLMPVCPGDYIISQNDELIVMSKKQFKETFKKV